MREQGAKLDKMKTSIDRLIRKHTNNFAKFEVDHHDSFDLLKNQKSS